MRVEIALRILTVTVALLASLHGSASAEDSAEKGPYSPDQDHLWNRLHRGLFLRTDANGRHHVHNTDPLLYRGGKFLLTGEPHRKAVSLLNEFLRQDKKTIESQSPLRRAMLQRDLWGAFDYVAWYPDEWVHRSRYEPAAMKLRSRMAKAIGRLSLTKKELAEISDNYAAAVASGAFALDHDPKKPKQSFLPADLFDPKGNWVRFRDPAIDTAEQKHFQGSGGRAVHLTFLRLPEGREATQKYLNEVSRQTGAKKQFPVGTMAALVRRAIVIDESGRMQPAPITELIQIRVYRRIPEDPRANFHGDRGEQDQCHPPMTEQHGRRRPPPAGRHPAGREHDGQRQTDDRDREQGERLVGYTAERTAVAEVDDLEVLPTLVARVVEREVTDDPRYPNLKLAR